MAIFSKKEFATACGIATNYLAVNIKRGKVILNDQGLIDTSNERNQAYYEKNKVVGVELPAIVQQKQPVSNKELLEDDATSLIDLSKIPSYNTSEKVLKYLDTQKREKEVEKLTIEIQKKKGEVVPSELIKPVFLQHNQYILMEMKNADEEMLTMIEHKYDISSEDVAFIRSEWTKRRNTCITNAINASIKGISSIVNEFTEKKGVGQRN